MNAVRFSSIHYIRQSRLDNEQKAMLSNMLPQLPVEVISNSPDMLMVQTAENKDAVDLFLKNFCIQAYAKNNNVSPNQVPVLLTGMGYGMGSEGANGPMMETAIQTLETLGLKNPLMENLWLVPGIHAVESKDTLTDRMVTAVTRFLKEFTLKPAENPGDKLEVVLAEDIEPIEEDNPPVNQAVPPADILERLELTEDEYKELPTTELLQKMGLSDEDKQLLYESLSNLRDLPFEAEMAKWDKEDPYDLSDIELSDLLGMPHIGALLGKLPNKPNK